MSKRTHHYSPASVAATRTLGTLLSTARRERGWTQAQLAERVGVSEATLASAERGSATVAIGTVFEMATVLGVPLFGDADSERVNLKDALIPARVRSRSIEVDDDF